MFLICVCVQVQNILLCTYILMYVSKIVLRTHSVFQFFLSEVLRATSDARTAQWCCSNCSIACLHVLLSQFHSEGHLDCNTTNEECLYIIYPLLHNKSPKTQPFKTTLFHSFQDQESGYSLGWCPRLKCLMMLQLSLLLGLRSHLKRQLGSICFLDFSLGFWQDLIPLGLRASVPIDWRPPLIPGELLHMSAHYRAAGFPQIKQMEE